MWEIMVVLQLMLPRDSLNNMVSLLSLHGEFTLFLANNTVVFFKKHNKEITDMIQGRAIWNSQS